MSAPITDQIKCVEREIRQRERVYPRLIEKGAMTEKAATYEIGMMHEVLLTLQRIATGHPKPIA